MSREGLKSSILCMLIEGSAIRATYFQSRLALGSAFQRYRLQPEQVQEGVACVCSAMTFETNARESSCPQALLF